jgi:threonine/homoserine/homoserine lactone efflux protein
MISVHALIAFIGALAVVYAIPGPDMALVLQTSTSRGFDMALRIPRASRSRERHT